MSEALATGSLGPSVTTKGSDGTALCFERAEAVAGLGGGPRLLGRGAQVFQRGQKALL